MEKGTDSECEEGSSLKRNCALGSMKCLINQAEETRSIPGRGRVIHLRSRYSALLALVCRPLPFRSDSAAREKAVSTRLRRGLEKKSIAMTSWKRFRNRLSPEVDRRATGTARNVFSSRSRLS